MKSLLVLTVILCAFVCGEELLCSQDFCDNYLTQNACRSIPDNCRIQNTTHSGIFLPFPGPCNCCDYCIENLDEDDACPIGTAGSSVPSIICGSGLYCTIVNGESTCQGIITDCSDAQAEYDRKRQNGELGHLEVRPACDRNGMFEPYKCIPGEICYCLSEEGERIFGEIPFTSVPQLVLNCKCSRGYTSASKLIGRNLHSSEFLRCQSDGNYDPLQCVDDNCLCVNSVDGSPSLSSALIVNMTSISNETLHCFNNQTHIEGEYYRECEGKYIEILNEIAEYEELGFEIFGYEFPECQLDGYYAPVQNNGTHVYCSDQHGEVVENFILEKESTSAESMNCKCARSRSIAASEKPECCLNGNYNPMQCRRGFCRCVDEDGNQIVKEVEYDNRNTLQCAKCLGDDD